MSLVTLSILSLLTMSSAINNAPLPTVHYTVPTSKMELALTFDDGPLAKNTPQVLSILKKNNIKATFFLLGENMYGNEKIIKQMIADGHEIGLHTYSHPNFYKCSEEEIRKEIDMNLDLLQKIANYKPKIIRPPYGIVTKSFLKIAQQKKLTIISWSNDSLDWKKGHNANQIYEDALTKIHPGAIILMHDKSSNYQESIKALPKIIKTLKEDGYSFKRISDFNL